MQRRYERYPRLMFRWRRFRRINYEREMELLDLLCDPAKTSIDVGAKLGMYTDRLLRYSRDVVAFEPIPVLARMVSRVFCGRPARVEACALSDHEGSVTMRVPFDARGEVKLGRSTIEACNPLTHDGVAHVETIEVPIRTLDAFALRDVGFLKIDVEGHELAVLEGAARTLERERPTLLVEANEHHRPHAIATVRSLLARHGYRGHFMDGDALGALDDVADPVYFERRGLENFLFVHASRCTLAAEIARRLSRAG